MNDSYSPSVRPVSSSELQGSDPRVSMLQPSYRPLSSWKEIAGYVGKGVRTVQRWEAEMGFPVRRPSVDRRVVIAIPSEIDAWILRNQDLASNGKSSLEEELADVKAENVKLSKRVAELLALVKELKNRLDYRSDSTSKGE